MIDIYSSGQELSPSGGLEAMVVTASSSDSKGEKLCTLLLSPLPPPAEMFSDTESDLEEECGEACRREVMGTDKYCHHGARFCQRCQQMTRSDICECSN